MVTADEAHPPLISGKQLELLKKAVEIEQIDAKAAGMVGYQGRLWAQVSLPYRDPGDIPKWVRENGSLRLVIRPGEVTRRDGTHHDAYPFGVIPRLLLTWMATEAVRLGDRELSLGPSLAAFMRAIGLDQTGGARVRRMQDHIQRLAKCSMFVEDSREPISGVVGVAGESFQFADSWALWWTSKDGPNDDMLWPTTITLSEKYFNAIKSSPIPIDLRALGALRTQGGGGLPIDLYTWLAHRMSYLRKSTLVPWRLLAVQLGSQYGLDILPRLKPGDSFPVPLLTLRFLPEVHAS
jgi:hypothetical protein